MRVLSGLLLLVTAAAASLDVVRRASDLYQRTDYAGSLHVLAEDPAPDAASYLLTGKNYFMSGDYKKAVEFFEKAVAASPTNSEYELWLGRAWGRRAETGGWLTAASHASKARQCFEKAIVLDPGNREAKNDLFSFYLNAPGFLGGGIDKAEAAAKSIALERPAQYENEEAEIADRKKDYAAVEAHFRRAMELAPTEPGRMLDLARYLAKRKRLNESDLLFDQAEKMFPGQPKVGFAEAAVDIENNRSLKKARALLEEYLHANLTPDDPPRQEAEKLLRRIGGSGNSGSSKE
jgi:Flp pilus assembly protein TadD